MQKYKITGIAGSVRSCIRSDEFIKLLNSCKGFDQLYELIYKLGGDKKISNSESLLMAALYGAMEMGMEINHVKVDDFFSKHKSKSAILTAMAKILENTKGIIISSPVYFGDRTSLIAEWINYMKICGSDKIPLDSLATGIVSVGAKRNGGQETTNVYALYDSLNLGACVVGNGPPTSQYGGTGVAGAIGMIIDDTFGLSTSRGTGQRVGILSKILSQDHSGYKKKVRILVIITCKDNSGKIIDRIRCLPFSQNVEVEILDITEKNILRCRACPICPAGDIKKKYTCIIPPMSKSQKKGDDMRMIQLDNSSCFLEQSFDLCRCKCAFE